ncbi:hypothetical protein N8500_10820 [Candidatus Puniceispirillum sp.]|nr:hypothetical protein [Candidatus Puniceispirillum sp.]
MLSNKKGTHRYWLYLVARNHNGCTAQCNLKSIDFTSVFGQSSDMDIAGFLEGKTPDHRGRILSMVLAFSDE